MNEFPGAANPRRPSGLNWRQWPLLLAALVALTLIIVLIAVLAARATAAQDTAQRWEAHTYRVMLQGQRLLSAMQDVETGQRGYLLTDNRAYLEPYDRGKLEALAELGALRTLINDNPGQRVDLDRLAVLVDQRLKILAATVDLAKSGQRQRAIDLVREGQGKSVMDAVRGVISAVMSHEQGLLRERERATARASTRAGLYLIVLALGALVSAALAGVGGVSWVRADRRLRLLESVREANASRDASEQRAARAAALVVAIGEATPDLMFAKDRQGRMLYANPSTLALIGKPPEQVLGRTDLDWATDRAEAETIVATDQRIMESGLVEVVEELFTDPAGRTRTFRSTKSPLCDADGAVIGLAGVTADVTEARLAEHALRASEERFRTLSQQLTEARDELATANADLGRRVLERTVELKSALDRVLAETAQRALVEEQVRQMHKAEAIGQLTGGIAHDFNNMLAIVIGSLDVAKRRLTNDPARARLMIEHAEEGAGRAAQLTARLLAFARQQPLAPVGLDANRLVGGMSELVRRTIGEQIHVETVLTGGLWSTYVDAAQLENALLNLCVNARDAMPDGGHLTIETANAHLDDDYVLHNPAAAAGQYVLICVTDTGTGMPSEVIERAFDPFYTTKGVGKGTGLGLSQVQGFIKQSGGHVKIYSEPGHGTSVKIYLPRHFGQAAEPGLSDAPDAEPPRAVNVERILVVEDEPFVRNVTVESLRELGYVVVHAGDGKTALEILGADAVFDLLFTDVVMPEMNGRRLAEAALKRAPDLKVLYTTGYTRNAVVHNGVLDPRVAFLAKPFTLDALARKVRAVLDGEGQGRT
jgi:PAS domain S-box-containing protein